MTLSANTVLHHVRGEQSQHPVKGMTTIYEGGMLGLASGYARELVAGDAFIGHAAEFVDNSSGSDGDLAVTHYTGIYRLQVTLTGVAITDEGKQVYASADDTLTLTPGSNSNVGVVVRYVTTNTAIVEFRTHQVTTLASDLTALLSNMATVSGASDFTVLQSDITAEKSDTVIFKSDIVVLKSDVTSEKSDTVIFKANRTKTLKAISDAKLAADAGDYVNVSDIKVTIGEIIKAFSDGLI